MTLSLLADREDALPTIARWYVDEWGPGVAGESLEDACAGLREYLNRDRVPLILLATQGDEVLGTAQLKFREMAAMFPGRTHWIGGVYVAAAHRGQGLATRLIERIVSMAPDFGVRTLHLQTEAPDGGLYARLGWKPFARVHHRGLQVLVMERRV